jgi:hypothetical protein
MSFLYTWFGSGAIVALIVLWAQAHSAKRITVSDVLACCLIAVFGYLSVVFAICWGMSAGDDLVLWRKK